MVVSLHVGTVFLSTEKPHDSSVFLRNLSTDFHSGCTTSHSDEKYLKALSFFTFVVIYFLDSCHAHNAALICIFLMAKDVQCFFLCLFIFI